LIRPEPLDSRSRRALHFERPSERSDAMGRNGMDDDASISDAVRACDAPERVARGEETPIGDMPGAGRGEQRPLRVVSRPRARLGRSKLSHARTKAS
jgi:hypothetical protein